MDGTVLVADDDRTIRTVLTQALTRAGCRVHATSSLTTLMRWVSEGRGDVVISDVMMPDGNGLEMLPKIAEDRPDLPVIIISAQNTIMTAIRATEANAFDYLPKPFDLPDLMKRVARALAQNAAAPRAEPKTSAEQDLPLIGGSAAMQSVFRMVARLVQSDMPVFVTGESGVGKSLILRALHDFSPRAERPFILATSEDLVRPEKLLTRAKGGTIAFEAVGELNAEAQSRLVRLLDTSAETETRFVATGRDGGQSGLREDLYYRLSGALIDVPPLRARIDDIASLADHFLNHQASFSAMELSDPALDLLREHLWPGNVRELEHLMGRVGLIAETNTISVADLQAAMGGGATTVASPMASAQKHETLSESVAEHLQRYFDLHEGMLPSPGLYARILREVELPLIEIALDYTSGNQIKCAELLGINRNTLRKKLTELDIRVTRRRKLM
ncbi:Nitrogen assimilation regulatory protein [Roseovarius albus]|uniref:DNA-binding transcriptional regulator NtrC n=1 Tax=Roseovarius albus TaxID=1247867 RepID=A0A1X6Z0Q0_9RHOB|nr:response regulator [Roseovarius albus]SLN37024.1 Nitrogen assimilation regulatory protein [Roseovarius albus]